MFLCLLIFFKINFFKKIFQEHYQSVNGLDTDQGQLSVGPDLGLNCLQSYQAASKRRVKPTLSTLMVLYTSQSSGSFFIYIWIYRVDERPK